MVQMLPYILPLLLGRTFDLNKMQVGVDIFPTEEINRKVVISSPSTETHYRVLDRMSEVRNFLDVEGSFSLNIKAGVFKAGASGQYLSDAYNRENTVEVAIKATYQTVTEQLPSDLRPLPGWKVSGSLGTHFVRSVTYGGEVIGAVRMECNNTRDKMKVKGALELGGKLEIFDLGLEAQGEYFKDVAKSVESTQIKVFSSIPLGGVPNDLDSLKRALDAFPDDLARFNGGLGVPLKVELWPLSYLDASRQQQSRNKLLEVSLDDFEKKFDDLLNTKTAIADWLKILEKPLTEEQEKKIGDYYESVESHIRAFHGVIGSLDLSEGLVQLKPAEEAYGVSNVPGTFFKKYLSIRQDIAGDQGDWGRSRGLGVTYVHWGRKNCSDLAEKMGGGTASGPRGFGGGADFLCLPPELVGDPATRIIDATILRNASLKYPNENPSKLFCSECRLESKGSVRVYPGAETCPDGWDYLYQGLLVSGSRDSAPSSLLCLDKNAERDDTGDPESPLLPNWVLSQSSVVPSLYPCVVCAY